MPSRTLVACLALLTLSFPASAQAPKTLFQGKEAIDEIGTFLKTRCHLQAWRIELKPIDGLPDAKPLWHVAGTPYWVRLDGPDHEKERYDLAKLDPKSVYEFVGVPVDLNYGTITFFVLSPPERVAAEAPEKGGQVVPDGLSAKDALCLAEACRITALMNEGKWDEVERAFGTKEGMLAILKHHATSKDWPGIGAYRGSSIDPGSPGKVTFRFGFAPKSNPHEIQISFTDGDSSKPGLMVLGW